MHRPPDLLGLRESLRKALRRISMEYMIAGLISLGLFAYLIYALLKPERF
jgi:K+-transporting ATPase KdpF subunit